MSVNVKPVLTVTSATSQLRRDTQVLKVTEKKKTEQSWSLRLFEFETHFY